MLYNSSIPYEAQIGKGTILGYGGIGVVIHKRAVIGQNVIIGPNVVIGGRSNYLEVPRIGDCVFIGPNSSVLGPITVGSNVTIGANSVVLKSVPEHSVVAGNPARHIRSNEVT